MVYYGYASPFEYLQSIGIFPVLIPFVLIFAIVYAILNRTKILGGKPGIDAVVAIAIALLAVIKWDFTTHLFYIDFFQNLGIGIAIILGILIIFGLFISKEEAAWRILGSIAAGVVFLAILIKTYGKVTWTGFAWWNIYGPWIIICVIIAAAILLVTLPGRKAGAAS